MAYFSGVLSFASCNRAFQQMSATSLAEIIMYSDFSFDSSDLWSFLVISSNCWLSLGIREENFNIF